VGEKGMKVTKSAENDMINELKTVVFATEMNLN
jgi:hypothetical protein